MLSKKKVAHGYLGEVDAYYGEFETGKRGVIHSLAQAMHPALEATRSIHLKNTTLRPVLLLFLEQVMCMYLPELLHDGCWPDWATAPDG